MSLINSKLLLFGEYTIIQKSDALALPLANFGGKLTLAAPCDTGSNASIRSLYNYIAGLDALKNRFELDRWLHDIECGLWFESNIPQGYGLGSSGVVCAAIYNSYCCVPAGTLGELKSLLATMECCWHGKSSGLDPLVGCLQKPLWIQHGDTIDIVDLPLWERGAGVVFLLDTLMPRQTTPLVAHFIENCKDADFVRRGLQPLTAANGRVIANFLRGDSAGVWQDVAEIAQLQWDFFRAMIPADFAEVWKLGLVSDDFKIKLCGAGGGGFLLGFARDWERVRGSLLMDYNVLPVGRW